jgi:16S rRNA processing protein RimM
VLRRVWIAGAAYDVESVWYHKGQPIFKLRGVDSIGQAEALAGQDVCVPAADRFPLPEGEYYFSDLTGCRMVADRTDVPIGTVTGWRDLGGSVVLEVNGGGILVPFAGAMLRKIDLEKREIRVELPEGLLDLNRD